MNHNEGTIRGYRLVDRYSNQWENKDNYITFIHIYKAIIY